VNYSNGDDLANQLASVSLNSEQAASLIAERAKQLVNRLIEKRGHDRPPFLPEEFARLQGMKIVKADLGETSAVLLRLHDGYTIKLNENHNPARQNFSCAHEIGHILFSELKLERYIRTIEYRTFNPQGEQKARARARERLCDIAATEFLMPELVFRKYLSSFGVSVHSIEWLANIFKVSSRAAAWRIAEVSAEPCIALMWQPWPRNRSKGLQLAWCAGPGRKETGKNYYMPVHTRVTYPSTLHKAYENDKPVKSFKLFKFDTAVKRCPMESKGFGRGETRYVISLAFPDR
jgi:Zn-dependent peptidase ImmA (M78 family)